MTDLTENVELDDRFVSVASDPVIDQSDSLFNGTFNGTSSSIENIFGISSDTMRLLFIVLAVLILTICLILCMAVCICICLNRRRKSQRPEKKDRLLNFEQSEKRPGNNKSSNQQISSNIDSNVSSSKRTTSPLTTNNNTRPFYYDNFDDIPFIDESRPTSIIDMTRV